VWFSKNEREKENKDKFQALHNNLQNILREQNEITWGKDYSKYFRDYSNVPEHCLHQNSMIVP